MRKGVRLLLLGVAAALLAAVAAGGLAFALTRPAVRGGTVLTYQVKGETSDDDTRALAGRLQQRLDPHGDTHVVVRPAGASRLEVVVPFVGSADPRERVEEVRDLVRQNGLLEFRVLANPEDDREGIAETQKLLDLPTAQDRAELNDLAAKGSPPFATSGQFRVKAAGDEVAVGYKWVELGDDERESLALTEKYEGVGKTTPSRNGEPYTNRTFDEVATTRGKTFLMKSFDASGCLLFSREHEAGKAGRKVDYFYLARESPADSLKVAGDVRVTAKYSLDPERGPTVWFEFVSGADKFAALTERNRPSGDLERQLAVILDGKVVSAPVLRDKLKGGGVISGNFTAKSAAHLAAVLNAGPLPAELTPDPVGETPLDETAARGAVDGSVTGLALRAAAIWGGLVFAGLLVPWVLVWVVAGRPARNR